MIIWGWRTCESLAEVGQFSCPVCRTQQRYRHLTYNRYFTLYFIPLIPLGRAGEQVECQGCFGRFVPEVLFALPTGTAHAATALSATDLKATAIEALVIDEPASPSQHLRHGPPTITAQQPIADSNPFAAIPAVTPQSLPTQTSSWAITSLILGILSPFFLCLFGLSLLTSLGAVICGHLALRDINRSQRQLAGHSNAIAGLVLGYLLLAVSIIAWATFGPSVYQSLRDQNQIAQNSTPTNEHPLRTAEEQPITPAKNLREQKPEIAALPTATQSPFDAPSDPPAVPNSSIDPPPFGFTPPPGYTPPQPYTPPGFMPPPGFVPPPGMTPPPGYGPPPGYIPPPGLVPPRSYPGITPSPSRPPTFSSTPGSSASRPTPRSSDVTRSSPRTTRTPPRSPPSSWPTESLDDIISLLKEREPNFTRLPMTLNNLRRIPVESSRQDEVARLLDPLLTTGDDAVRHSALEAVKVWGVAQNVPTLLVLLDTSDMSNRWSAMDALGKIGGSKAAADRLADLLTVPNDSLPAKRALEEMGSIAEDAVWPQVGHADILIHTNACQILGKIGTVKTLDKLKARRPERDIARRVPIDMTIRQLETTTRRPR